MHAASVTSTPHSSDRSQSCVQLFGSPEVVPAVVPLDSDSPAVPLELVEVEVGVAVEVDMEVDVEVDMEVEVSPSVALSVAPPPHATNISEATIAARAPRIIAQQCMPPTVPQPLAQALVWRSFLGGCASACPGHQAGAQIGVTLGAHGLDPR